MIALIDADIVTHRVGFTTDAEEEWIAFARCDEMLDGILVDTEATEFQLWLSDARDNTFRAKLYNLYKANRVSPRPKHYDAIKEYLITKWDARIASQQEADDELGINQDKSGCETVICSVDKDLLQIPGQHYNFVKKEWQVVSQWEGLLWFYKQLLIGDTSDNIKGCTGIGPVKAQKILGLAQTEYELFCKVFETYQKQEEEWTDLQINDHVLLAGRLLKIRQSEEEELWNFPELKQETGLLQSSTPLKQEENIPFTEPTISETMNSSRLRGVKVGNTFKVGRPV